MFTPWRILPLLAGPVIGACLPLIGGSAQANPISIQMERYGFPSAPHQVTALTISDFDTGKTSFKLNKGPSNGSVAVDINTEAPQGVVTGALGTVAIRRSVSSPLIRFHTGNIWRMPPGYW